MSGVSLPVTRPAGQALLVGNPASRGQPLDMLAALGYACDGADDPYSALAEVCRQPNAYHAIVLSLAGIYKEELAVIATLKRQFPHIEVWLAQADGRHSAMAEGLRLGADGLLSEDGLHRIGLPATLLPQEPWPPPRPVSAIASLMHDAEPAQAHAPDEKPSNGEAPPTLAGETDYGNEMEMEEPVLTAEELRALLQEQPSFPPNGED